MVEKKNIPLIVGLSLPIVIILAIALSIYLPRLWAPSPQYDFIYVVGENRYAPPYYYYEVDKGKVVRMEYKTTESSLYPEPYGQKPRLYVHDVETNNSKELTLEEAQQYRLRDSNVSPDGFNIACGRESGMVLFVVFDSHSDCSRRYLQGHHTSVKLNVWDNAGGDYYYHNNFQLLGWVLP